MKFLVGNILITGTSSGFGKFLLEKLNGTSFYRNNINLYQNQKYDTIIHCGWNTNNTEEFGYIEKQLSLVQQLLRFNCNKFIFISTIDVYPSDKTCLESDHIDINKLTSNYSKSKFLAEEWIADSNKPYLILRPSTLLGIYTKNNTSYKLANRQNISVSRKSVYNYVSYDQLLYAIRNPIWNEIINVVGIGNVSVSDLIKKYNLDIMDGKYVYQTPRLSSDKFQNMYGDVCDTSENNFNNFAMSMGKL